MRKLAIRLFVAVASTQIIAAQAQDNSFVPRLIGAIEAYTGAYRDCLIRTIGAFPVAQESPEQIATAAMAACEKSDQAVIVAYKRVQAFPSVANFMAGTSERIFAYSVKLAKNRIAAR